MPLVFFVGSVVICLGLILFKKFVDSKCNTTQTVIEDVQPIQPIQPILNDVPPKYEEIIIEPPPSY